MKKGTCYIFRASCFYFLLNIIAHSGQLQTPSGWEGVEGMDEQNKGIKMYKLPGIETAMGM